MLIRKILIKNKKIKDYNILVLVLINKFIFLEENLID